VNAVFFHLVADIWAFSARPVRKLKIAAPAEAGGLIAFAQRRYVILIGVYLEQIALFTNRHSAWHLVLVIAARVPLNWRNRHPLSESERRFQTAHCAPGFFAINPRSTRTDLGSNRGFATTNKCYKKPDQEKKIKAS
jgi:hypothetical protein